MNQNVIRALAALGVIGGLVIAAPLIFLAVQAGAGLLAIGLFGVVGFFGIKSLPMLGQKFENRILEARKAEAARKPIEQMQNYLLERTELVEQVRKAAINIGAQIRNMKTMVADYKRTRPNYDATERLRAIQSMEAAHTKMVTKYQNAEKALVEIRDVIKDKEFEWKFSQEGQKALAGLNAVSGEAVLSQLLFDEASSSVMENFNKVFAELEVEAQTLTDTNQITYNDGMVIDLSEINIKTKV